MAVDMSAHQAAVVAKAQIGMIALEPQIEVEMLAANDKIFVPVKAVFQECGAPEQAPIETHVARYYVPLLKRYCGRAHQVSRLHDESLAVRIERKVLRFGAGALHFLEVVETAGDADKVSMSIEEADAVRKVG